MKKVLVFVHTRLYNTDIMLATPSAYACFSSVFTSFSDDYAIYTPIAFENI